MIASAETGATLPLVAPTPTQRRLLQAAALDAPLALEAWAAWQRETTVPSLEPDSQWLLPALWANLRRLGMGQARLRRYAFVYRHYWYQNHLLLRAARPVLAALEAAGRPALLLGGAALAVGAYPAPGARPMEVLVIASPGLDADLARLSAAQGGWRSEAAGSAQAAWEFTATLRRPLRLQPLIFYSAQDLELLARSRTVRVAGTLLPVLDLADQLLHVLLACGAGERRSRLLWALDAAWCLRGLGAAGRAAVLERARALGVEAAVTPALAVLEAEYGLGALRPQVAEGGA
jgi:hypothetical protein